MIAILALWVCLIDMAVICLLPGVGRFFAILGIATPSPFKMCVNHKWECWDLCDLHRVFSKGIFKVKLHIS